MFALWRMRSGGVWYCAGGAGLGALAQPAKAMSAKIIAVNRMAWFMTCLSLSLAPLRLMIARECGAINCRRENFGLRRPSMTGYLELLAPDIPRWSRSMSLTVRVVVVIAILCGPPWVRAE